jgi:hypothetical protein
MEQGGAEWLAARCGIPTASNFSKIVTSDGKPSTQLRAYAAQLAAEMFAGKPLETFEGNDWTDRGTALEDQARSMYAFSRGVDVETVGLVLNYGAAASPDGFVGADGLVEIKCLAPKHHVLALAYYRKHGRIPTDYVPQVAGQILVCERAWCDLFFFHPELPPLLARVQRDETLEAALKSQIDRVIAERDELLDVLREAA